MQAALCALLGSASSYAYLVLMQQQVDAVSATDEVPMWDAEDNAQGIARPFAIGLAAYRWAVSPQKHSCSVHDDCTLCEVYICV